MSKLICNSCGAPINGKVCKWCDKEIDDTTFEIYKQISSYLPDYEKTIKGKINAGEELNKIEDFKFRQLLDYQLIDDKDFDDANILFCFLNRNKILSYETFEVYLKAHIEKTMRDVIKMIAPDWNSDFFRAHIEELEPGVRGSALGFIECKIGKPQSKDLYEGYVDALVTVYHEMYHVIHNLLIENNYVTPTLMQIIKEYVIRDFDNEKNGNQEQYYYKNYKSIASEIFAHQLAINLVEYLAASQNKAVPEDLLKALRSKTDLDFSNQNRVITIDGEEKIVTVDGMFDEIIKNHPEKLESIPQLNLEYINDNGSVRRKNKKELKETLEALEKPDAIAYVQYILDNKRNLA